MHAFLLHSNGTGSTASGSQLSCSAATSSAAAARAAASCPSSASTSAWRRDLSASSAAAVAAAASRAASSCCRRSAASAAWAWSVSKWVVCVEGAAGTECQCMGGQLRGRRACVSAPIKFHGFCAAPQVTYGWWLRTAFVGLACLLS